MSKRNKRRTPRNSTGRLIYHKPTKGYTTVQCYGCSVPLRLNMSRDRARVALFEEGWHQLDGHHQFAWVCGACTAQLINDGMGDAINA